MTSAVRTSASTLPELFQDVLGEHADTDAYVELDRRISYAELDRAADGVATAWAALGVGKGEVVGLLIESSIEYAICYHAAIRLGAVTSGINPRLGSRERESVLARLEPALVVGNEDRPAWPGARQFGVADVRAAAALDPDYRRPRITAEDPVAVVWTSGTTDLPKGAVFDHSRMAAMARAAGAMSAPGDRRIYPLPFAHTGYMTRRWDELANAMTCVITPARWTAADSLLLMGRERVTVGQGVATQWELMLRSPHFDTTDLSAMRIAMMGASSIPAELVRAVRRRIGCPVVVRYTSTEACVSTGTRPDDPVEVVTRTVGVPLPGVQVRLVDDAGAEVPAGSIGRIQSRSAAMMSGYWRDPERTAAAFTADGWLVTGDLGHVDRAGNLCITGRLKDMYIRGGYNVYPEQVEALLRTHPAVSDAAVIGVPDPVLGEIGHAFVVPRCDDGGASPSGEPTLAALRSWVVPELSDYKAPDRLTLVPELPRNAMGKLERGVLLQRHVRQAGGDAEPHTTGVRA